MDFCDEDLVNGSPHLKNDLSNSNSPDPGLKFWRRTGGSKRLDKGRDLQAYGRRMMGKSDGYNSSEASQRTFQRERDLVQVLILGSSMVKGFMKKVWPKLPKVLKPEELECNGSVTIGAVDLPPSPVYRLHCMELKEIVVILLSFYFYQTIQNIKYSFYSLGQHAHFVLVLLVVAKLYLDLEGRELDGIFQADWVGAFQDGFLGLFI